MAAPASVTIDTRTPVLEEADDGASKIALGFLNLTDGQIELSAKPQQRSACVLTLDKTKLEPAENTAVTVSIPATCKAGEGLAIHVVAAAGSVQLASFEVVPEVKPVKEPNWHELRAFAYALGAVLVLLTLFCAFGWKPGEGATTSPFQRLKYLDATWKFNDNWVTNVTAIGALLTGVFGASTAKAFLGTGAESAVALATVGAAIALALVAAGPVVLLATKSFKVVDGEREDSFTAGGLLLAAALILASAFGQLWVVMATGEAMDLGGLEEYLCIPFGLAGVLLFVYAWRSLKDLLERSTTKPKTPKAVEIRAAETIARAIKATHAAAAGGDAETFKQEVRGVTLEVAEAEDPYRERTRSALL